MIKFEDLKKSAVVFDEATHTYRRGDEKLSGITSLIHDVLQLGVYPDASDFVLKVQIPKAGYYGTCVHKAIQMYNTIGIEMVKFPEVQHPTAGTLPAQDVTADLAAYKSRKPYKVKTLASEFTVSMGMFASQIDEIWVDEEDGIYLVDFKTNNLDYYPGNAAGLKEYLSWAQTGYKVKGLVGFWLRKGDSDRWDIVRQPDEKVIQLLETEILPKPHGGFIYINEAMQVSTSHVEELKPVEAKSEALVVPSEITTAIANLVKAEKAAKVMKEKLRELMEKHGVTKWECDAFTVSIGKDSVANSFDAKALEAADPETYKKYLKSVKRKGSFTIKAK